MAEPGPNTSNAFPAQPQASRKPSPDDPRSLWSLLLIGGVALLLAACGPVYPLGMSEAQWQQLTPEQQMQASYKQSEIDKERALQRQIAEAERKRREERERAREEQRIRDLYRDHAYGTILECRLDDGQADFHPGWRKIAPTVFKVALAEEKQVTIRDDIGKRRSSVWAHFSRDGRVFTLCPWQSSDRGSRDCMQYRAKGQEFANGISQRIDMSDRLRARIQCSFAQG